MRHILIILSLLLLSFPLFGQSERPETIIVPVSSMGDVSDTRKQILQNTLEDELKTHFRLVPQQKYEEVQEKVFEELGVINKAVLGVVQVSNWRRHEKREGEN